MTRPVLDAEAVAVALQAQGTLESSTIEVLGGATAKVKAVGALNAGAIGGSAQAFVEYDSGRIRAGLGASASALVGAKVQVGVEIDMSKFSFRQLAADATRAATQIYNDWRPAWAR